MEDLNELKKNIADNLIFYRKKKGLTQLDIAEKLSYSDKAVSKWERAEAVPDIYTLKQLADLYNIKVDDLLSNDTKRREKLTKSNAKKDKVKKILVTVLSCGLVWLIATILYIFPAIVLPEVTNTWLIFIWALAINFIILVVFSCIWSTRLNICLTVSGLIWTMFLAICLTIGTAKIWWLFVIGVPLQILTILWFVYMNVYKPKKKVAVVEEE